MVIKYKSFELLYWALLLLPSVTDAHPFNLITESDGFVDGVLHPLTNADHILTMLAVGLWISQTGLRWMLMLPVVFVLILLVGGLAPIMSIDVPFAKYFMYFSVLALGMLLINAYKTSRMTGGVIVAAVAFFHGYVHVYDMMLDVEGFGYMAGFIISTLLLVVFGILSKAVVNLVVSKAGSSLWENESE